MAKKISIHASAKEATLKRKPQERHLEFQSTPPRRRRHESVRKNKGVRVFQSTPPRRRRPVAQAEADRDSISIHASAKEATNIALLADLMGHISIHASAKEATAITMAKAKSDIFQSTPPRRRRPLWGGVATHPKRFQSTPPRRRRRYSLDFYP